VKAHEIHFRKVQSLVSTLAASPSPENADACTTYIQTLRKARSLDSYRLSTENVNGWNKWTLITELSESVRRFDESKRPKIVGGRGFDGIPISRKSTANLRRVV
jgi:hypothetical protein